MQITLPDPTRYGAAFLVNDLPTGRVATVVIKQAFDLVTQADGTRMMQPATSPARHAIVFEDAISTITETDADNVTTTIGYLPRREADIAPEKPHADLAVLGLGSTSGGGALKIGGRLWITRQARDYSADRDARENLFGFQAKGTPLRDISARMPDPYPKLPREDSDPKLTDPEKTLIIETAAAWETSYTAQFNNFHRRGNGFAFLGSGPGLTGPQAVEIFRTSDASDTPVRIDLPDLTLSGRYRFHSGQCPDLPNRWAFVPLDALPADTAVFDMTANTAFILWRANWPFNDQPADAYRRIEILKEAA